MNKRPPTSAREERVSRAPNESESKNGVYQSPPVEEVVVSATLSKKIAKCAFARGDLYTPIIRNVTERLNVMNAESRESGYHYYPR